MGDPGYSPAAATRVLLVEDDALIALCEEKELLELGYDVAHARNAEEALRFGRGKDGGFSLVLMDVDLGGGMDGIVAAREMRKTSGVHIIFLSSRPEAEISARASGLGSWSFFPKGRGIAALVGAIRSRL
jgi:two-component system, response regulator PdtaR